MTTTYDDPRTQVTLARLALFPLRSIGHPRLPLVQEFLDAAIEEGLVEINNPTSKYASGRYFVVTEKVPSAKELYDATTSLPFVNVPTDSPDARFAAQAWKVLLLRGVAVDNGSKMSGLPSAPLGQADSILHVLLCGLDLARSTTPEIETWVSFTDTVSPSDEIDGLAAMPFCVCGRVGEHAWLHYDIDANGGMGSLIQLLAKA